MPRRGKIRLFGVDICPKTNDFANKDICKDCEYRLIIRDKEEAEHFGSNVGYVVCSLLTEEEVKC